MNYTSFDDIFLLIFKRAQNKTKKNLCFRLYLNRKNIFVRLTGYTVIFKLKLYIIVYQIIQK